MTNLTYSKALEIAISAVANNAEVAEKLTALKAQIEKKNSAERKPTKAQKENAELRERILEFLCEKHTATEVAEAFGISNQRATALLTVLKKSEAIERTVEHRKAYFKAVA